MTPLFVCGDDVRFVGHDGAICLYWLFPLQLCGNVFCNRQRSVLVPSACSIGICLATQLPLDDGCHLVVPLHVMPRHHRLTFAVSSLSPHIRHFPPTCSVRICFVHVNAHDLVSNCSHHSLSFQLELTRSEPLVGRLSCCMFFVSYSAVLPVEWFGFPLVFHVICKELAVLQC